MGILLDRWSLQYRITASVGLGLGVILILFGYVAFWSIGQATDAALHERQTLATMLAHHVKAVLGEAFASLEQAGDTLAASVESGHSAWGEPELHRPALRAAAQRLPSFTSLSLLDGDGRVVLSEPPAPELLGTLRRDHPGAALALQTGRRALGEWPHQPAAADHRGLCLAVPIYAAAGQRGGESDGDGVALLGVLMADFDPQEAGMMLRLPEAYTETRFQVELVDRSGVIIANSVSARAHTPSPHSSLLRGALDRRVPTVRIHHVPPESGRVDHIVAYAPLPLQAGLDGPNNWGVIVEQAEDVVLSLPHRLRDRMLLVGAIALFAASILAWFDVRRVVRPLRAVTAAARRIAGGDLDAPLAGGVQGRRDEVGQLTTALNTMRGRLIQSLDEIREWNQQLEQRVEARTEELSRLEAEHRELLSKVIWAQEEERRRLAQELHDETSQALASLQLGLERLATANGADEDVRRLAAQLQNVAAGTLEEVHRLAVELRPSILDDVGLVAAIERYLGECGRRCALGVDFATVGMQQLRLIPAAETAIYRIVQGALTNVVQHAQARHVNVLFQRRDGRLVIVIEDDGRGFDLAAMRAAPLETRLGLAGMDERASLIGAALTIETAPGAGATVFLEVPLDRNRRAGEPEETNAQAAHRSG